MRFIIIFHIVIDSNFSKISIQNYYRLFAVVIMERSKFTKMIHCFPNFLKTLALFKYRESVGNIDITSNGKSFQNLSNVFNKYEWLKKTEMTKKNSIVCPS